MHHPSRWLAHGTVLCLLLSCGDSAGPNAITGDFALTSVNGAPPPGLVGATIDCDELIASGTLGLTSDHAFILGGVVQFDCTRAGGQIQTQVLSLGGSYAQNGHTLTFTLPGQGSISGQVNGTTVTTTIPATPFTFPTDVALVFTLQSPP
jgi:hypothetical protein